jgi:hypothetical protein
MINYRILDLQQNHTTYTAYRYTQNRKENKRFSSVSSCQTLARNSQNVLFSFTKSQMISELTTLVSSA